MNDSLPDTYNGRAIATAYLGFGSFGILGGELALAFVFGTPVASALAIAKGLFFVVVSSAFVGLLVNRKNRRIEAQQASVRASLRQLENVVSASPVPILAVTPDERVTRWNEAATDIFGWSKAEVLGKPLPTVSTDRQIEIKRLLRQSISEGGISNVEVELKNREGEVREFLLSTALIRDESGAVSELVGVLVDTTEQKQRERRLREYEMAIDQAGHAIYLTTKTGEITYVNPAFEQITGYSRSEAIGATPKILNSGEMDTSYYEDLWTAIQSGETWQERIVDQRKGGELYTAIQTIAPIHQDDEIQGFVAIQSDITDSEVVRQRLGVLNRMFRHNLRNRMNVIGGYAQMVRDETDDEGIYADAENIVTASKELVALSKKAQTVAEVLEGDGTTKELSEIIEYSTTKVSASYPDSRVVVDVPADISARVDSRVSVAVCELLTNALEHGGETVHVDVSRSPRDEGRVVVRVSDDGPGLPEGEWLAIERGRETPLEHGTGMGLWLIYWVVTKAGGSTRLDETPLGGASIEIELPVEGAAKATRCDTDPVGANRSTKT
ncbi:PAS domain S-box protein [Haloferax sp. YSSS75]|uniref:PAS domain S-box protein n=1 Tax=Haloferax sp. YSSS75 TaxID=3388564 RepID=UPI00398D02CA